MNWLPLPNADGYWFKQRLGFDLRIVLVRMCNGVPTDGDDDDIRPAWHTMWRLVPTPPQALLPYPKYRNHCEHDLSDYRGRLTHNGHTVDIYEYVRDARLHICIRHSSDPSDYTSTERRHIKDLDHPFYQAIYKHLLETD